MATNDFQTFAGDPAANVMTQAAYIDVGFTARQLGFSTGTALSVQLNKVWRQASLISHMIGQFTADATGLDMLDDGTPSGLTALESHFTTAIRAVAQGAVGTGYLPLVGGTLTGPLTINAANALAINAPAGQHAALTMARQQGMLAQIAGYTGSNPRWAMELPDGSAEQGSNTGSNFDIISFTDAGAYLDTPLSINRATGVVNFSHTPTVNGSPMAYLPLAGGTLTGALGVGGTGIAFPGLGGFWGQHHIGLGWDGNVECSVDGTFVGTVAMTAWVQNLAGGYLPLIGGVISGNLQVNQSFTAYGTSGFGAGVYFHGLPDFANFWDGRNRYRQWAGNWFDYWDGQTGNRAWYCATGNSMSLDGNANLSVSNNIRASGGRIFCSGLSSAVIVAWNVNASVATGFWTDSSGLWLGNADGNGNPVAGHVLIDNNGASTFYGGMTIHGSTYTDSNITAGGSLSIAGIGQFWNNWLFVYGGYPQIALRNTSNYWYAGMVNDGNGLHWGQTDGNGNFYSYLMTLDTAGNLFATHIYPSDPKLKRNIKPAADFDSLRAICALPIMSFDMNRHHEHGLLSTDLRQRLSDAVVEVRGYDGVDAMTLITHAFHAIRQLNDKIEGRHV
jgi:hypothetical protein